VESSCALLGACVNAADGSAATVTAIETKRIRSPEGIVG